MNTAFYQQSCQITFHFPFPREVTIFEVPNKPFLSMPLQNPRGNQDLIVLVRKSHLKMAVIPMNMDVPCNSGEQLKCTTLTGSNNRQ
jgi:hypothetical protein